MRQRSPNILGIQAMIEADTFGKLFQAFIGCCLKNATPGWCRQIRETRLLFPKRTNYLWGMILGKRGPRCQLTETSECLEIRQINPMTARSSNNDQQNGRFGGTIVMDHLKPPFFLNRNFHAQRADAKSVTHSAPRLGLPRIVGAIFHVFK
jgi:hypothetical protein